MLILPSERPQVNFFVYLRLALLLTVCRRSIRMRHDSLFQQQKRFDTVVLHFKGRSESSTCYDEQTEDMGYLPTVGATLYRTNCLP